MTSSTTQTTNIRYATVHDVFAAFDDNVSVSVEEFPRGEIVEAAKRAERKDRNDGDASLVLSLTRDEVGGAPNDTVWFHPDEDAKLEVIDRARTALDNAEAALLAVGYIDRAHQRAEDYMTVPQRERNAFELGQDAGRLLRD